MTTDNELRTLIETELLNDNRLSSHPVRVRIRDGIVQLEGAVQSHRRKLLAHKIASHYEGVREVVNDLTVTPAGPLTDEEVANHVRSSLDASADITRETIQVSVVSGRVVLSGTVSGHWERSVAEDIARSARGVRDVENLLIIDADSKIADEELANAIKAALSRAQGLTHGQVSVAISDDSVVLSGEVQELWQRAVADDVVRSFGLLQIRNDIVVTSL